MKRRTVLCLLVCLVLTLLAPAAQREVCVLVVLEGSPLGAECTDGQRFSQEAGREIHRAQENLLCEIESQLGFRPQVRYRFSYLANALSLRIKSGDLADIAALPGVKSVFPVPQFSPSQTVAQPQTALSGSAVGVDRVWTELGITGKGMKIAVIDTGLDTDHPSFAADPAVTETSLTASDLEGLTLHGQGTYLSAKVPFAYNYADANLSVDHGGDDQGDHGTHVSGIACANRLADTEVAGMAPDAQLVVMKVFGATRAGYLDDVVAALEDALVLGCDVVNLSLGRDNGFTASGSRFIDQVFANLENQDVILCAAAGNAYTAGRGNRWGNGLSRTCNPENGVVSSPATYLGSLAVASADNGFYGGGNPMSPFSSWGTTADLRLVPQITGIGGYVYSCYDGGGYGYMSGTSMATPHLAGVSALVLEELHRRYPGAEPGELRSMALALLLSTAEPVLSGQWEASPRQQGAGLVNAWQALQSQSYLTVAGGRPKGELGASQEGVYTLSFEIHNLASQAQTFTLSSSLLTEAVQESQGQFFMAGWDQPLEGSVSTDGCAVTVDSGATARVEAVISVTDKAYFDTYWPNGGYVEGFLYLEGDLGDRLHLPFLGFYGDWRAAPVFDGAFWYEEGGDQTSHLLLSSLEGTQVPLGINPYYYINTGEAKVSDSLSWVLSPNGDGWLDGLEDVQVSLLRNVEQLTLRWTCQGTLLATYSPGQAGKTVYDPYTDAMAPWSARENRAIPCLDTLPSGSVVELTVSAGTKETLTFSFCVDTQAPQVVDVFDQMEGDRRILYIVYEDHSGLAYAAAGEVWGYEDCAVTLADGRTAARLDITGCSGSAFQVTLGDFGGNSTICAVTSRPRLPDGWFRENGRWYYRRNGQCVTGWQHIGGVWYYFGSDAAMATGWVQEGGHWYYLKPSGAMATGWVQVEGCWYYLQGSGAMETGWLRQGDVWYYLRADGAMATGWAKVEGAWYYLSPSGAMVTGWLENGGEWYYLGSSGAMATRWLYRGGLWYYLRPESGVMVRDTALTLEGRTYVFGPTGACLNPYGE